MSSDLGVHIPKNKSTGNLLSPRHGFNFLSARSRFSFDAGSAQEMNNLKRCVCLG